MSLTTDSKKSDFCIVSNFRIDSDLRLQRMKDSFASFNEAEICSWNINVRGSHAHLAEEFLKQNITQEAKITRLESGKGWFHDTSKLVQDINNGYILYWIEDHINTASIETLNSVLQEISKGQIDQIQYSFFSRAKFDSCDDICSDENQFFRTMDFSRNTWEIFLSYCNDRKIVDPYLISLASIMSTQTFKAILGKRDPRLRRHSKHTPFDFEKNHNDVHWLPLRTGFLRNELFANIDTDHDGASLISRGLYSDAPKSNSHRSIELTNISSFEKICKSLSAILKILLPKKVLYLLKRFTFHLR